MKDDNANTALQGSLLVMILFDVSDEIRLNELKGQEQRVSPTFKHAAPEYVHFQHPPVAEALEPAEIGPDHSLSGHIKYYDYGVISVLFERSFAGSWDDLVQLASSSIASNQFEEQARAIVKKKVASAGSALRKLYPEWLVEDYFVFHLTSIAGAPKATDVLATEGDRIAQIVRGENTRLADAERDEVLLSRMSYYPHDLAVIGWNAAFVYDTAAGAQTAIQLLEYCNSQLLEFRHYDELLTRELAAVYGSLERGTGMLRRFRLVREANRLQAMALDVTELAERADNAIKFLSDMFSARLYRLAAAKVGVPDYEELVHQKLRMANELYSFMVEQFQQARTFALELMVVVILVIELVFLFRGK
jgi:hypothetical protein